MTNHVAPLLTNQGTQLLAQVQADVTAGILMASNVGSRLRKDGIDPLLSAAVATQITLRAEAVAKFGTAAYSMLFTRAGLEQSTRSVVADLHATRLTTSAVNSVADFGCGLGGDSMAFARSGLTVLAVERDPETASCATVNLCPFPNATVVQADLSAFSAAELTAQRTQAVFLDPARRKNGVRIQNPSDWSPPLSEAIAWHNDDIHVGIKVAPGIDYTEIPADFHAQWVSVGTELVECSLWSPGLSPEGPGRSASIWTGEQWATFQDTAVTWANQVSRWSTPAPLGDYIFEPNSAIIRAGLIGSVAEKLGLAPVSEGIAYLTGTQQESTPALKAYRVIEVCKLRPKVLGAALHRLGATSVEIKKRGVDIEPGTLRRQLKLKAASEKLELTVILTRLEGAHRAIIAQALR